MTISKKVKKWLEGKKMTQTELAAEVGISKELLSHHLLHGDPKSVRYMIAKKVEEITNRKIKIDDFFSGK